MATLVAINTPEDILLDDLINELKEYKLLKASWNETKLGPAPELSPKNISLFILKQRLEGKEPDEALQFMSEKSDIVDHAEDFAKLKKEL